jgi:hypothetical protein
VPPAAPARRRWYSTASGYATGLSLLRSCSGPCSEAAIYCNRTATGLVQASTQRTNAPHKMPEYPNEWPNNRTHQDGL